MAITTFTELKSAIDSWTARADLTSRDPEFIALCEAKLQRELRARDMETRITNIAIGSEYVAVPADFLEVRYFEIGTTPRQVLKFETIERQTAMYQTSGPTVSYSVVGAFFRFAPTPSPAATSTLVYFAKIPPLGASQTTNWVLASHPDVYLYGSLLEAAAYLEGDQRLPIWKAAYDEAVEKIRRQSDRARWGGTGIAARAENYA